MTFDGHHIHIVGRYRQGQHTLLISRSQGQSQGHEGHFRFLLIFAYLPRSNVQMGLLGILDCGTHKC